MALPPEKKEKLKEQVADEVYRSWKNKESDLTKREVDPKEARKIVEGGIEKAAEKWVTDHKDGGQ
jgi:hypothetical protein